jgi:hypothetical protein
MYLVLKDGRLFDTDTMKFIDANNDWNGHGNHWKTPINTSKAIPNIPYQCECGVVLTTEHDSNQFKD